MSDNPAIYTVFKRSATNWKQFAGARKYTIATRLTWGEAKALCERENARLTPSQRRRGTKYEFTS